MALITKGELTPPPELGINSDTIKMVNSLIENFKSGLLLAQKLKNENAGSQTAQVSNQSGSFEAKIQKMMTMFGQMTLGEVFEMLKDKKMVEIMKEVNKL